MKLEIKNIQENLVSMFRRAGYILQRNEGDEMSFVRPFSRSGYPRFHIYAKLDGSNLVVDIHFDAKKETYGSGTRHHGEYENEGVLKEEMQRLRNILK